MATLMAQPAQKPGKSRQDYATPDVFIEAIKRRLKIDHFEFDFAADVTNAKALRWYDQRINALTRDAETWARQCDGDWGWLNPPFAQIGPWARQCRLTKDAGGQIAFLVPAAVGSNWFRDEVDGHALVLLLNGRIAFDPTRPTWGYPKDCILCLYSNQITSGYEVWNWRK